jgi:SAM-dependent methyltransferase
MAAPKTEQGYWDDIHAGTRVRMRLPSPLDVGTLNYMRLMRRFVRPGMRVLEVGFAPGKYLAWTGKRLGAKVCGVDYSESGLATSRRLFAALGLEGDLRCEDFFKTTFEPSSMDLVYSLGVVEHFDDPRDIVSRHVSLARPGGGVALIVIPNYGGLYGRLQGSFDPENLAIHNTSIMSVEALRRLGESDGRARAEVFRFGRMMPHLVSWTRRIGHRPAVGVVLALNGLGLLQPVDVGPVCPWLVLALTRT